MSETPAMPMTKRDLLALIGKSAGATTMLMAMSSLGQVQASTFKGPIKLEGGSNGRSVLILGAGVAGMVAALELSRAGYKVQVLEYNDRIGGRAWTLRGGDKFTELGGATQTCEFAPGNYINPGPWRIPTEHGGLIMGLIRMSPAGKGRERGYAAPQYQCMQAILQSTRSYVAFANNLYCTASLLRQPLAAIDQRGGTGASAILCKVALSAGKGTDPACTPLALSRKATSRTLSASERDPGAGCGIARLT